MADYYTPTAVANEALNAAGVDFFLGDIAEGTEPAQVCLRNYSTCLQQMLRTAGWNFARKQADLLLLADATGQTPNVETFVPGNQFLYCYAMPQDSAKIRYIPWNPFWQPGVPQGNITPPDPSAPLMTGIGNAVVPQRVVPARYLVTSTPNYIPNGAANDAPGVSPIGRTVICTNVKLAQAIYTFNATYPNLWDEQFRAALVAYLASMLALPLSKDKRVGMQMRDRNIAIAQEKIKNARVSDGNEGWHSSDLAVDWMRFRNAGGGAYTWGGPSWWAGVGDWNCGWDSIGGGSTGNSSAY